MENRNQAYEIPSPELQSMAEEALKKPKSLLCQTLLIQTASGNVYAGENPLAAENDYAAEEALLQMLSEHEDTEVRWVCAVWHGTCIDLPSYHLRQRLLELSPQNGEARVVLMGEGGYNYRSIAGTMPDKNRGKG